MRASVIPSAKYSWPASPERFSKGRTAMERIWALAEAPLSRQRDKPHTATTIKTSNPPQTTSARRRRELKCDTTALDPLDSGGLSRGAGAEAIDLTSLAKR